MFEKLLVDLEDSYLYPKIFFITLLLVIGVGLFTKYVFNHPYILFSLTALGLSYPVISHLIKKEKQLLATRDTHSMALLLTKEAAVYLTIFFSLTAGFFLFFRTGFIQHTEVYDSLVPQITGNFLAPDLFIQILLNNIGVALLAFGLSVLLFSGFIFVLSWNASILAFYLSKLLTQEFFILLFILPHLLFEITGFILAGLAGNLFMYGFQYEKKNNRYIQTSIYILVLALVFVFIGAVLEVS